MKAIEMAVLKLLEYRLKYDTMSCSSCFAADVLTKYNNKEYPCEHDSRPLYDADNVEIGCPKNCVHCKNAWVKAFEVLEEKGIDIEDTMEFNC